MDDGKLPPSMGKDPMHASQATSSDLTAWVPYKPSNEAPWDLRRVVHLHRRAAFAAPWDRLQADRAKGPQAAVDRLLGGQEASSEDFEAMARTIGDAASASGSASRLRAWWLYRMLTTSDPLSERLTLMWHNHFATSNRKVQNLVQMREQNDLLRKHCRAPFGELLSAVVKHPAMVLWLDAESNRQGHPNENLAREMMELFTLGIGNYSENDVQEAARALTGWTIVGNRFALVDARHDSGEKVVLGRRGALTGDDFIEMLVEHPATARRVAWRICQTFMGEGAMDETAFEQLAQGLASRRLDVGWAIETVLRSERFFSNNNLHCRVVGPIEYMIGSLRALELSDPAPSTLLLSEWAARMGQDLFYPPNVGGWSEGRAWLTSRTIVARANFASALVEGRLWHPAHSPDLAALHARHATGTELQASVSWFARLFWGDSPVATVTETVKVSQEVTLEGHLSRAVALLLSMPEHQLA